jgi:membrane-associated phospholipid phosphatase
MKNFFRDKTESLKPVELALSAYLLFTTVLIVVFYSQIDRPYIHLSFRILVLSILGVLITSRQSETIRFFRVFFPFILLGFIYSETDVFNNLFFKDYLDPWFANIESRIFGMQPSIEFSQTIKHPVFAEAMYFGYFSYFLIAIGIPLFIYFKVGKDEGEHFAFIIINSFLLYYVIFIFLPVAGPQYYFSESELKPLNGLLFESITKFIQHYGERPTGAFPSSHVSICLMLLYGSFRYYRKLLLITVPISIVLILSTVYIRAHYAVDVIAGFTFTPLIYTLSVMIYRLLTLKPINVLKLYGHSNKRS